MRRLLRFLFPRHGNFRAERARADRLAKSTELFRSAWNHEKAEQHAKAQRLYDEALALAEHGSPEEAAQSRVYPAADWTHQTVDCVSCPGCAFTFDAFHITQATGRYDCPVCGARSDREHGSPEEARP